MHLQFPAAPWRREAIRTGSEFDGLLIRLLVRAVLTIGSVVDHLNFLADVEAIHFWHL